MKAGLLRGARFQADGAVGSADGSARAVGSGDLLPSSASPQKNGGENIITIHFPAEDSGGAAAGWVCRSFFLWNRLIRKMSGRRGSWDTHSTIPSPSRSPSPPDTFPSCRALWGCGPAWMCPAGSWIPWEWRHSGVIPPVCAACVTLGCFPLSVPSQGMGYLHAKGILHKDLKSKNVFYDNGKVVITDFGLFSISGVLQAGR